MRTCRGLLHGFACSHLKRGVRLNTGAMRHESNCLTISHAVMALPVQAFISSSVPDSSKDVCPLQLPSDWHVLHKIGGLRSFAAVPIIRGGRILGVLNVASPRGDALDSKG